MIDLKRENRSNRSLSKYRLLSEAIFSIPKTIYFNFRCFSFSTAVKLPVLVSYQTKLLELHRGIITFGCTPSHFMVKFGFGGSSGVAERKSLICLEKGHVYFDGKAVFSAGTSLRNAGTITFGHNFWSNKNCTFWSSKHISFGENVLLGWNIVFRDADGHQMLENGIPRPVDGDIIIGNHCWICSESHILKNSGLGNDCVLGYGSLLVNKYYNNNVLYIGRPAIPKKYNISWIRGT